MLLSDKFIIVFVNCILATKIQAALISCQGLSISSCIYVPVASWTAQQMPSRHTLLALIWYHHAKVEATIVSGHNP